MRSIFLLTISCLTISSSLSQSGVDITKKMFKATQQIKTLTYRMKKTERIDGEMITQISSVKLSREPYRLYSLQEYPNKGLEVLFTENSEHALINPNGFPWFNIKLDPDGSTIRQGQHHTLFEAGYDHVVDILKHLTAKYEDRIEDFTTLEERLWDNRPCWSVEFNNPHFGYMEYTAKAGETIASIAKKLKLSAYMILQLNKHLDGYNVALEGQTITIPNDYSPKMTLLIDKELMVPVVMEIHDEHGLFEFYEYSDITINPELDSLEFTPEYHEYGF